MEKILLVEPDYKNKYPPLGLMKLATYHRQKGDIVEFYKGEAPYTKISQMDRVYITTLFTFHYDITIKCISHYSKYISKDSIFVGGIAASLLTSEYKHDTGVSNILCGQLTNSKVIGYDDNVNIDLLPLDYDILDDVLYKYPAGDNYFVHTTRGCPRGCEFCAVKTLEPEFKTTNNIIEQIKRVDAIYGPKRNMLVMDNNILCSSKLVDIINDIRSTGFNGEATYISPNPFNLMMNKVRRRISFRINYSRQLENVIDFLDIFSNRLQRYEKIYNQYLEIVIKIKESQDIWSALIENENDLYKIIEKYRSKPKMIRYVDLNQGIDARLINHENVKLLSTIPIKPFRLAYDSIDETDVFTRASKLAIDYNIKDFSNYMLYNWKDNPKDLWIRLHNAIKLYNSFDVKINAFSFPMKYAPIDEKDRAYVGVHWNKKYLSSINIILNVTNGIVAKEEDFFEEAFGSNLVEYLEILMMPDEFIRHRHYFKKNGLIEYWKTMFHSLSNEEVTCLLDVLCKMRSERSVLMKNHPLPIKKMLVLYMINKLQFDKGEKSTDKILIEIENLN